jgi:hypothetical protein
MKISNTLENKQYTSRFYQKQIDGSARSAQAVLHFLYSLYKPLSVIDIGCGHGAWLATAESLGSLTLKGLDGPWVDQSSLLSKNINFSSIDFEKDFSVDEKYDLCISVEVAEHLPESRSRFFIQTLCKSSDVVLFSAAIKEQGGTNHINEQWQSYWINLFDKNDYDCLDIIRPVLWKNEDVEWWYRQNIFLFVRRLSDLIKLKNTLDVTSPITDIVHPVNFENRMKSYKNMIQYPTLFFCLTCFKRYIEVKIERLKGKMS